MTFNYCYYRGCPDQPVELFHPEDHYDIKGVAYVVPQGTVVPFFELHKFPTVFKGALTMLNKSEEHPRYDFEPVNTLAIGDREICFHTKAFQEVKAQSPYIHEFEGLTTLVIEALADSFNISDGITNHSYVRFGPEQVFSISQELQNELLRLDNTQLEPIARAWREQTELRFTYKEKKSSRWWRYDAEHDPEWDLSEYTVDYFMDVLLNMYEMVRYCDPEDTIYISVDY